MSLLELLWLPPVVFAIALVVGTSSAEDFGDGVRAVLDSFLKLTVGVVLVGVVIHVVAQVFA